MRETAQQTQTRTAIPRPASLAIDPDRLERMWAMTPAQRRQAAQRGQLSLGEMLKWASRRPHEVPIVNGEFFFITAYLADAEDSPRDAQAFWDGEYTPVPQPRPSAAASDTSPEGEALMPLQASRTIGTGDGWQRTDSGILLPDWADLPDTPPTAAVELPQPQPIGIDLFAGAGGFSCGFKQAGWHVIAANEWDVDAAHTYLANLGGPSTRIVFCTPEDQDRWERRRQRLERYHAQPDRPSARARLRLDRDPARRPAVRGVLLRRRPRLTGERILTELDSTATRSAACSAARPAKGSPAPANGKPTTRATSSCSSSCGSSAKSTRAASAWRTSPGCSTWSPARASR